MVATRIGLEVVSQYAMATVRPSWSSELLEFLDACPTPHHAVQQAALRLSRAGFIALTEREPFHLKRNGRYYYRRGSTLVAFRTGASRVRERGIRFIGAHTDSPGLRLKPRLCRTSSAGYALLDVEIYGNALLHTWLDRDLAVAGRVLYEDRGRLRSRLVASSGPVCRVPSLAVHLQPDVNTRGLVVHPHEHLVPVLARSGGASARALLTRLLAPHGIPVDSVRGHDLRLVSTERAVLAGVRNEFVLAARLDNLAMCHAALSSLVGLEAGAPWTTAIVLFDHEEVGSESATGARGSVLRDFTARLIPDASTRLRALRRSFFLSADMGHAVHPSFPEKHDERHAPVLGDGPLLKTSANQRYATSELAAAQLRTLAREAGIPLQEFVPRSDVSCGSTLGPLAAAELGVRTADIGSPLLSMHSIREMAHERDHAFTCRLLERFFGTPRLG